MLGSYLKKIRNEKGLSLRELSTLCDVSVSYISDIENDRNDPSIKTLKKICDSLDIKMSNAIKCYNNESKVDVVINSYKLNKLIKTAKHLDDEKLELLLMFAKRFKN